MKIWQHISLMWRRFSPLQERLLVAVREVLPLQAQPIFDAQIAGVTFVQRLPPDWLEISFYRRRLGTVDWSDIPGFPRNGEFKLAEVQFRVEGRRYKATLTSVGGHVFDFTVTPSPKAIAFADWDSPSSARLLSDPMRVDFETELQPIPGSWREFLERVQTRRYGNWTIHDSQSAIRTSFAEGEFLVLAECEGEKFILHRIEPPALNLYYLGSHDETPEPLERDLDDFFRE